MSLDRPLVELVAFDGPVSSPDGYGGRLDGWLEKHRCHARFRHLRAGEAVIQARLEGQVTLVATVRRCTASEAIRADWRMRDTRTGTVYNVRSIIPTDDRLYLEITCQSGVAA